MSIALLLVRIINAASYLLSLLVIAKIILSYFMNPWHPVRQFLDRLVNPLLRPIQRIVPPLGMIDFSPLILLILIEIVARLLIRLIVSL